VVATANDIERLPAEVLRKGRFDEIFFVDLPSKTERMEIFRIHLALKKRDPKQFDLEMLAAATEGYSGAEIEQTIIEAMFSVYGLKADIETTDVVVAARILVPLSRTMRKSISSRRMWALGRTVNASSTSDTQEELERPDATDTEKEVVYMRYLEAMAKTEPATLMAAEAYLGAFPGKQEDLEKMRLYANDFERLCRHIGGAPSP
jgi:SpoVK/Ycf46/Vps4 family AAA+-type ATPase